LPGTWRTIRFVISRSGSGLIKQVYKNEKGFTLVELLVVIEPLIPPAMFHADKEWL
jgi:hypothetical protein